MNKNILLAIVSLVIVFGGTFLFVKSKSSKVINNNSSQKLTLTTQESENVKTGSYFNYSKSNFEENINKRRVLFFYASWCPTCRPADSDILENAKNIPEDVVVIRVNYNDPDTDAEEKELAKKYQVTYQHTFVQIDTKGEVVTKWNGGKFKELISNIK